MRYVAGIDGGQSGTQAAVVDERGRVLGEGSAGASDEIGQDARSTRLRDTLAAAVDAARIDAGLDARVEFAAVVAGVSGYEGRLYGAAPALPAQKVVLVHDAVIAHAAALRGRSGVVVIAGTGSIGYVVDDVGHTGQIGGLGYVFGDEGSAFWIAKRAIASALAAGDESAVGRRALEFFEKDTLREIFAAFYHGALDRDRFASFARTVLEMASSDDAQSAVADACAIETVERAQRHLARLAEWAEDRRWQWRSRPRASFIGGLLRNAFFKEGLYRALRERAPDIEIVEPAYAPALGAALLALREAGVACDRLTT